MSADQPAKVLIPESMLRTASRRGFLGALATGSIGAALLAACGGDTINVYNQIHPMELASLTAV